MISEQSFHDAVLNSFAFLADFGFRMCEEAERFSVCYNRYDIIITVTYEGFSGELDCNVQNNGQRFNLYDFLCHMGGGTAVRYTSPSVSSGKSMRAEVGKIAALVRDAVIPALDDENLFDALLSERDRRSQDYAMDILFKKNVKKAREEFKSGNYKRSFDLYSQVISRLNTADLYRMRLARRRINCNEK